MLILIIVNIIIIIYIYLKYYNTPKNTNKTKEEIEKIDPIIIGYIYDKGFNNNFDFILSEILNLNIKGYLKIEYDRDDINAYDYTIKQNFDIQTDKVEKYELIILNFLFSEKTEISKNELEEKLINTFNSYNVQYNDLKEVLQEELIKQYVIDKYKSEELNKISKIYKRISIISIIILFIMKTFIFKQILLLYIWIYIVEKIISNILILDASKDKGEILRNDIIKYKTEIENQEYLVDKKTINQIILEKRFANSIALHINTEAKRIFINDEMVRNATKHSKKAVLQIVILLSIVVLVGIILQKITISLTGDGIFWLYTMLVIIIAFVTDITKILGETPKRKN